MFKVAFVCLFLVGGYVTAQETEILHEKIGLGVRDTAVLVAPEEFSVELVERLSREFLDTHRGLSVAKFSVFVDRAAEVRSRFGKAMSHPSYYHAQLDRRDPEWLPTVAEMVQIGPSAILRVRMPDGSLKSLVIRGSNPLQVRLPGLDAEILYVFFGERGVRRELVAEAAVRTSRDLSSEKAEQIADVLQERMNYINLTVEVRADEWFIESDGYPWINPFLPLTPLPSYEEFAQMITYYCSAKIGKMECTKFGLMHPVKR